MENYDEINLMIEHIFDDFHEVCVNLGIKKRIKTSRGIIPMQDVKINYLINALNLSLNEIIKRRLYKGERDYYKIYELLYEDVYRVSKQITSRKNQLALGQLIQTLKEKDHSLFEIWRKKIPKSMLQEKDDPAKKKSPRKLNRNMTMQISIQNLKELQKNKHVEKLYALLNQVNESDPFVNTKQNELYELINAIAMIEGGSREEFQANCTIYFEEVGESLINFVNITGIDSLPHSEEIQISGL